MGWPGGGSWPPVHAALTLAGEKGIEADTMRRLLFLLSLGALVYAARAELPIDLPTNTPTNQPVPGINVPAPLGTDEPTNTVIIPPSPMANSFRPAPLKRVSLPADGQDSLTFTNGDQFAGTFAGFEGGVIRWQSPISNEPIRFRTTGLDEVALAPRAATKGSGTPGWLVLLADGSLWPARQVTVETGHVVADLAHVGQVRLERQHVAALRRGSELVALGDAPGYAAPPNDNGFVSQQVRYRDTKLPDPLLLEFPWTGDAGKPISLYVFAGKPENLSQSRGCLHFYFSRSLARVQCRTDEHGGWVMADLSGPIMNRTARPIWVGLAVNRKSGQLALYLDGQLHRRGMLIAPLHVADFGLAVAGGNPRFAVVSRINDDLTLPAPPADQDAVRLANSDQLAGKVESVTTNEFVIQAATGRLVLPLERLAQITFARGAPVAPRAGEALVALQDGTVVRGVWQRTDAQSAVVQHAVLGPVTVPRTLLAEVDYETVPVMDSAREWLAQHLAKRLGGPMGRLFVIGLERFYNLVQQPGLVQLQPDNNLWHGDLLAITNGIVRWQHPAALDPFALPLADVQRICPLPRPLPVASVADRATVVLANGDVLSGLLAPGQDDAVRVTPWYLGPLVIPRRQVARLTPHAPASDALRWDLGLTDGALWTDTTPRTGTLPDRLRLDFEAVWGERPPLVNVKLYQDENTHLLATFQFNSMRLGAQAANQLAGTNILTGALANLAQGGCATVTILADRTNRHLRLLVDGRPAGEWRGSDLAAPTGHGLAIVPGYGTGVALRHIVLREWREDPVPAPAQPLAAPAARTPPDARVILHNGDFLTLTDIAADAQTVTGRHALLGPVALNMAAVRSLSWEPGTGGARPAKR
jgi:hypothetical protein